MARLPPQSFTPPTSGSLEQRVRIIGEALSRKADLSLEPVYSAVLLVAPGGATWRLSVDDTGAVSTVVVARS
jgi:hypothetical protein